ncbi:MAG: hypothetical protein ABI854_07045 [Betaproteobacteria bacterium]
MSLCLHATPGQLDPTFGVAGVASIAVNDSGGYLYVNGMATQTDGKILLAGYGGSSGRYVYRLLPNGAPDQSFGVGGKIAPAVYNVQSVLVQADGNIIVCGGSGSFELNRFLPNGAPDPAFGTNGISSTVVAGGMSQNVSECALAADGKIVAVGSATPDYANNTGVALRLNANGTIDTTFGVNGVLQLTAPGKGVQFYAVALQADGKVVVGGSIVQGLKNYAAAFRLLNNGTLDPSFGSGGIAIDAASAITGQGALLLSVRILPNGSIVGSEIRNNSLSSSPVVRFSAAGIFDSGFGVAGAATSGLSDIRNIAVQADGAVLLAGDYYKSGATRLAVARLNAAGQLDQGFASGGIAVIDSVLSVDGVGIVLQPDGKVLAAGPHRAAANDIDLGVTRLLGNEIIGTVVEFYNSTLKHYFVTADPAEASAVDAGAAGPGWSRTGFTFKSGGINRVCRFYGSSEINPATGLRRGPNSHFYTVDTAECGLVQQDPGWHFESYDFSTNPPLGTPCQAGTIPVYRAYNGLFAKNDSNHRLTTNLAQYNQTVALGWVAEGVVMCAPQ